VYVFPFRDLSHLRAFYYIFLIKKAKLIQFNPVLQENIYYKEALKSELPSIVTIIFYSKDRDPFNTCCRQRLIK